MSDRQASGSRRPRAKYSKLICLGCRERRIRCELPDDVEISRSDEPQRVSTPCYRCKRKGIPCLVRSTKLGRPSSKTRNQTRETTEDSAPSSEPEDELMRGDERDPSLRLAKYTEKPDIEAVATEVYKTFDLLSSLLAKHRTFGSLIGRPLKEVVVPVHELVDQDLARHLESQLCWLHLLIPWLPSLLTLRDEVALLDQHSSHGPSAVLVFSLLCSIAIDVPGLQYAVPYGLRDALDYFNQTYAQMVTSRLPNHMYTLHALELIDEWRPFSMSVSRQAATSVLNNKLYLTLAVTMATKFGLPSAPAKLRLALDQHDAAAVRQSVVESLRWCSLMLATSEMLDEKSSLAAGEAGMVANATSILDLVQSALDQGYGPTNCLVLFNVARCRVDGVAAIHRLTELWSQGAAQLAFSEYEHRGWQRQRGLVLERHLENYLLDPERHEETLAIWQYIKVTQLTISNNIAGMAMFYAVIGTNHTAASLNKGDKEINELEAALSQESKQQTSEEAHNIVQTFLDSMGPARLCVIFQALEKTVNFMRNTQIHGVRYYASPVQVATSIILSSKELLEGNLGMIKYQGMLNENIDQHLELLLEAANQLNYMEVGGGSAENMARGSVLTGSSKVIRNFHKFLLLLQRQWNEKKEREHRTQQQKSPYSCEDLTLHDEVMIASSVPQLDTLLDDGFLADLDQLPPLDDAELDRLYAHYI